MEKKLKKSKTQRKLFGVCGGFAEYLDCDVTLLRLLTILVAFAAGSGLLFYVLAAIVMPNAD